MDLGDIFKTFRSITIKFHVWCIYTTQLAYNQTLLIQDAVTAVTDQYVMNLYNSVDDLQKIVSVLSAVIDPLQAGLDGVREGVNVSIKKSLN